MGLIVYNHGERRGCDEIRRHEYEHVSSVLPRRFP